MEYGTSESRLQMSLPTFIGVPRVPIDKGSADPATFSAIWHLPMTRVLQIPRLLVQCVAPPYGLIFPCGRVPDINLDLSASSPAALLVSQ